MNITKYGHACLLIEEGDVRLLIDPGEYSTIPHLKDIDAVLITHEHGDHLDMEALKKVFAENFEMRIITNEGAAKIIRDEGLTVDVLEENNDTQVKGVSIKRYGHEHALMYEGLPRCVNGGFMIADRLFHPGDSFFVPPVPVEILALPVSGPWMKLGECIDYAKAVNPKVVFPIHDGMLKPECLGSSRHFPTLVLTPLGIEFRDLGINETIET